MTMKFTDTARDKTLLTAMLQYKTPGEAALAAARAYAQGAEAIGLQMECFAPELQTRESFDAIRQAAPGLPIYVTNYRVCMNEGLSDEELAEKILGCAEWGADLCDVMGDMFCRHPDELTDNPEAIVRQQKLINEIHQKGSQVLMSSHLYRFAPAERVLEIAARQKRRGADVLKIVTAAGCEEEQLENLRIQLLLQQQSGAPFLFLSGNDCYFHRRLSGVFGSCLVLCVTEHHPGDTPAQPLLSEMQEIRKSWGETERISIKNGGVNR